MGQMEVLVAEARYVPHIDEGDWSIDACLSTERTWHGGRIAGAGTTGAAVCLRLHQTADDRLEWLVEFPARGPAETAAPRPQQGAPTPSGPGASSPSAAPPGPGSGGLLRLADEESARVRSRRTRPSRHMGTPEVVYQARNRYETTVWRAAQHGLVLTRERRLLGTVHTLADLDQTTATLYDLREVHGHLDRLGPPGAL